MNCWRFARTVASSGIIVFSSTDTKADLLDDLGPAVNLGAELKSVPPIARVGLKFTGAVGAFVEAELESRAPNSNPVVVYTRLATDLAVGPPAYIAAGIVASAGCARNLAIVNAAGCVGTFVEAGKAASTIVDKAKSTTGDGAQAFLNYGEEAAQRESQRQKQGYTSIDDWQPVQQAHQDAANIFDHSMRALGFETNNTSVTSSKSGIDQYNFAPLSDSEVKKTLVDNTRTIDQPAPRGSVYFMDEASRSAEYESQYSGGSDQNRPRRNNQADRSGRACNGQQDCLREVDRQARAMKPIQLPSSRSGRCGPGLHGPDITTPNPQSCF